MKFYWKKNKKPESKVDAKFNETAMRATNKTLIIVVAVINLLSGFANMFEANFSVAILQFSVALWILMYQETVDWRNKWKDLAIDAIDDYTNYVKSKVGDETWEKVKKHYEKPE